LPFFAELVLVTEVRKSLLFADQEQVLCSVITNTIYSHQWSYLFSNSILVAGLCKTSNSLRWLLLYSIVRQNS